MTDQKIDAEAMREAAAKIAETMFADSKSKWGPHHHVAGTHIAHAIRQIEIKPKVERDCPHAAPFRYCPECVVDPCPVGLGSSISEEG